MRHVITKLENHEGREITVEELVDQYYKDPDTYFEVDNSSKPPSSTGGETVTAIAVAKTSIVPKSAPRLKDENNIAKEAVNYDYLSRVKNDNESQQTQKEDVKSIEDKNDISNKLIDEAKANNFTISEERKQQGSLSFQCFQCFANDNNRVEHISSDHP